MRDLDLGVGMQDLTFGHVHPDLLEALFGQLEFGSRTRTRLLKTFNNGGVRETELPVEPRDIPGIVEPVVDTVDDAAALKAWIEQYCPQPDRHGSDPAATLNIVGQYRREHVQCAEAVAQSWTLHAQGSAKPGHASMQMLAIMASDHAIVIDPASDMFRATVQDLLNTRAGSLCVHGFKEHLHMLDAAGIQLTTALFDTNLAGYLIDPEFQGGTLEACAEHFLNVSVDTEERPAQGTLAFDIETEEGDPQQECIERAALVTALARYLAPDVEQRHQYPLLRDIELPTSRVLFQMEKTGASVDRARFGELYEQFSEESARMEEVKRRA